MITLASGLSYIDLRFLDTARVIATVVLHGPGGVALIDPGPSTTLPTLRAGLASAGVSVSDVRTILLTHIHLDHAGATGTLVHENRSIRVFVHEKGAPHMADPTSLMASAARLWGDEMDRLWGEMRPVPPDAIVSLTGGERGEHIEASGRILDVAYTPGHASHHVSYFCRDSGVAFVGDTAGVCLIDRGYVLPPTPPPDIDIEAWRRSLAAIGAWRADTVFLTQFGPHAPVGAHLAETAEHLEMVAALAKQSLAPGDVAGTDPDREAWFTEKIRAMLRRQLSESDAHAYEVAGRFDLSWRGLARYWRKRA
jgi:glyoxylase-like metal-dependent hydrolase (beta-lactamase superfamily II)